MYLLMLLLHLISVRKRRTKLSFQITLELQLSSTGVGGRDLSTPSTPIYHFTPAAQYPRPAFFGTDCYAPGPVTPPYG